jgi:hypothetical protein
MTTRIERLPATSNRSRRLVCTPVTGVPSDKAGVGVRWGYGWLKLPSPRGAPPELAAAALVYDRFRVGENSRPVLVQLLSNQ